MSLFDEPSPVKVAKARVRKAKPVKEIIRSARRVSDDDLILISALQALEPLLHSDSLGEHKEMLDVNLTPDQRARVWRLRHGRNVG